MALLDVVHPAAKTLVDISLSQDAEVGDGTTSVVLIGAELLKQSKSFIEENMHPQIIIKSFRKACQLAVQKIKEIEVSVASSDVDGRRKMLERVAGTALNSKLISRHKSFFAPMVRQFNSLYRECNINQLIHSCVLIRLSMQLNYWMKILISRWLERRRCLVDL